MTRTITIATRGVVLLLAAFGLSLSVVGSALADEDELRDYWVKKHQNLQAEVLDLRSRFDLLDTQYRKSRQRNYPRGEERNRIRAERDAVEKELAVKEQELADFPDEARRAGALPGWFRD
jgi:hypothetical protein